MTNMERPDQRTTADRARVEVTTTDVISRLPRSSDNPLRRRREAALRRPPFGDDSRRDPLDPAPEQRSASTFGLEPGQLRDLARHHFTRDGWAEWECRARFDLDAVA